MADTGPHRLILWIDEYALASWRTPSQTRRRGAPRAHADAVIELGVVLQAVYGVPLRATQGLLASIVESLGVQLPVPDSSTLCRRRKRLKLTLPPTRVEAAMHVVMDATGVKVFDVRE